MSGDFSKYHSDREQAIREKQSFSQSFYFEDDGLKCDPKRLSQSELRIFSETLGGAFGTIFRRRADRHALQLNPPDPKIVEYFMERLDSTRGDIRYEPDKDPNVHIYNRAILYFYDKPIPAIGPSAEDSILSGVISTIVHASSHQRQGHKVVHITKTPVVKDTVREYSAIRKLYIAPLDFEERENGSSIEVFSTVFANPPELQAFLLPGFEQYSPFLDEIRDWTFSPDMFKALFLEQTNFLRGRIWEKMRKENRLTESEYQEKLRTQQEIRKKLKELEMKRGSLTSGINLDSFEDGQIVDRETRVESLTHQIGQFRAEYDSIEEELFGKREKGMKKKRHSDNYARSQWRYQKSRLREGEV